MTPRHAFMLCHPDRRAWLPGSWVETPLLYTRGESTRRLELFLAFQLICGDDHKV